MTVCFTDLTPSLAPQLGKTLYHQGDLSYFEAVSKETLRNSYQRFEEEAIIHVVRSKDWREPARLCLAREWRAPRDPAAANALVPAGRLWDFTERIASSRREGKNRRDGATVSTRVLRLTDELGARLFASDAARRLGPEEQARVSAMIGESQRRRQVEHRAHL